MAQVSDMVQSMAAAAERVFEFLDEEEEELIAEKHSEVSIEKLTGNVAFKNVNFGYNPDKIIINNFGADVKQG